MFIIDALVAVVVWATDEFPGAVFIIDALVAVVVWATDEFPGTVFIIDALVAVEIWATDEFPRAASFFGAIEFANTFSDIGTGGVAVEFCVEQGVESIRVCKD